MASNLKVSNITDGVNTLSVDQLIKTNPLAYVVMDTTTTPVTVKSHHNISSITDLGVGLHTLNFIKPMPSVNYYVLGNTLGDQNNAGGSLSLKVWGAYNVGPTTKTANAVTVALWSGNSIFDSKDLYVLVGGGL